METDGGVISGLFTVIDIAGDVAWLPAASRATAVSMWSSIESCCRVPQH